VLPQNKTTLREAHDNEGASPADDECSNGRNTTQTGAGTPLRTTDLMGRVSLQSKPTRVRPLKHNE
jgi:hypothetical protein